MEAADSLERQGRIVEIRAQTTMKAIANAYCEGPESTLVVSLRNRERVQLNFIHRQLQHDGKVSRNDRQMTIYVNVDTTDRTNFLRMQCTRRTLPVTTARAKSMT